jgi:NADP-dependent 3-hydroxy acid dehydrogenase YdfG
MTADLTGSVALVTGGNSGIGRAIMRMPASARAPLERLKARSCALQYGHHDPR